MHDCVVSKPILIGHGAPSSPPDLDSYLPLYQDLDRDELWLWVNGAWQRLVAPLDWMKARLASEVHADDWLSVHDSDYKVVRLKDVYAAVADALSLGDLTDVRLEDPQARHVLWFDGEKWVNRLPPLRLVDLQDVDRRRRPGGELILDADHVWRADGVRPYRLSELDDVDTAGAAEGKWLVRGNDDWIAADLRLALDDLADVSVTSPAALSPLVYDGTKWVAGQRPDVVVSAQCVWVPPDPLPDGWVLVVDADADGEVGRLLPGAQVAPPDRPPAFVICPDGGLWQACPGSTAGDIVYRRVTDGVFDPDLMVLVASSTPPDVSQVPVGRYWLQVMPGGLGRLMYRQSETCDVDARIRPRMILQCSGCGLWVRSQNLPDGRYQPARVAATQVDFDGCPNGTLPAGNVQDTICRVLEGGGVAGSVTVGPCDGTDAAISREMTLAEAICALDGAIGSLEGRLQASAFQVTACPQGVIDRDMTLQEAICVLSENVTSLFAASISFSGCTQGPARNATNVQEAVCALSPVFSGDAITSVPATHVVLDPCPGGPTYANAQEAVCGLAGMAVVEFRSVVAVGVVAGGPVNLAVSAAYPAGYEIRTDGNGDLVLPRGRYLGILNLYAVSTTQGNTTGTVEVLLDGNRITGLHVGQHFLSTSGSPLRDDGVATVYFSAVVAGDQGVLRVNVTDPGTIGGSPVHVVLWQRA